MQHPSAERTAAASPGSSPGSADASDVARFDAIAEDWWDPAGKFRPLHELNPLRLAYITERIAAGCGRHEAAERPLAGLRVLDVGCGGGLVAEGLARLGAETTGIDASETSIAVARRHAEQEGVAVTYECAVPEDLAARQLVFDAVVSMEVVEHVADVDAFLRAIAAVARPGGTIVLATLNRTLKSLLLAKVGAEYVLRWVPPGTHDWRKFIKPHELARALARHRIAMTDARGITYDPLTGRWRLGGDLAINYLCAGTRT
ncbi:MAG: bifunctional 2-polyprenyl-6-hydroxyphenol methylase/3-demethylubiquinol 3-O-methyltransferase UbiG [Rhodospirillales bacterium]|jgi:2-polyprenyl-6-hydroxyphenyl methylase/3-demethylubiquinone-9 3-methyltransferase|nr:bifunctional 2-polyprenyl-6-hydroxyphenol methylase/3-demethylubiquinol 3-O-methyltransferase UbiG [Rhodospirillales bacterium]